MNRDFPEGPLRSITFQELASGSGAGVLVAVVDSGINPSHPHVGTVLDGASFRLDSRGKALKGDEPTDRIGHGTACAAAIRELLPQASLLSVRVFWDRLEADSAQVAAGILWALERGAQLVNLSLAVLPGGSANHFLASVCRSAAERGAAILAARPPGPSLPLHRRTDVISCGADRRCPPDLFFPDGRRPLGFLASPAARSFPGFPPEANYRGPSLATARISGFSGKIIERTGPLPARELRRLLARWSQRNLQMAVEFGGS